MSSKTEAAEQVKAFKELSIDELIYGVVKKEESRQYVCVFCGESFADGLIYSNHGKMMTAERAALEHVKNEHGGSFNSLLNLDKQICGLTDIQKSMLINLYEQNDNNTICDNMGITPATVRTHKFNLQKAKREAKIFLALMEIVEDERLLETIKPEINKEEEKIVEEPVFSVNSLHPFFTQYKYR